LIVLSFRHLSLVLTTSPVTLPAAPVSTGFFFSPAHVRWGIVPALRPSRHILAKLPEPLSTLLALAFSLGTLSASPASTAAHPVMFTQLCSPKHLIA
jgi:hypothetical protein